MVCIFSGSFNKCLLCLIVVRFHIINNSLIFTISKSCKREICIQRQIIRICRIMLLQPIDSLKNTAGIAPVHSYMLTHLYQVFHCPQLYVASPLSSISLSTVICCLTFIKYFTVHSYMMPHLYQIFHCPQLYVASPLSSISLSTVICCLTFIKYFTVHSYMMPHLYQIFHCPQLYDASPLSNIYLKSHPHFLTLTQPAMTHKYSNISDTTQQPYHLNPDAVKSI